MPKPVTWWVYHINCDCCAYDRAYNPRPRWRVGPRCRHCGRGLGPMSYDLMCRVKARSAFEAIKMMKKWERGLIAKLKKEGK